MSSKAMGWMLDPLGMVTKGKVKGLAGIFGIVGEETYGKKKDAPVTPTTPSASDDLAAATSAAAERAALANDKRKASLARSRTVYTSPLGVSAQASTARKTLTGQ